MLDWFYDTPIVRAIIWIEKNPIIKKKSDYKIKEEEKRLKAKRKRNAKKRQRFRSN